MSDLIPAIPEDFFFLLLGSLLLTVVIIALGEVFEKMFGEHRRYKGNENGRLFHDSSLHQR